MAQQLVHETTYEGKMSFQPLGIFRLVGSVVKLPFLIIKGISANVLVGFRIFVDTAEEVGLPR